MSRDHSHSYIGRKGTGSRDSNKVVIFAEGRNTEYSYCDLLKKNNCKLIPVVKRGHGIGSCIAFVEESNKKYNSLSKVDKAKYKQKWLIYDYDGHQDFRESILLARRYGFKVVFQTCA